MTEWNNIAVPFSEQAVAAALGAKRFKCENGAWGTFCTAAKYKSKAFVRWRDPALQRRVPVFPDASEAEAARARFVRWDPATFSWYVISTAEDPASEMDSWLRARLEPAPLASFVVPFKLKAVAKQHRLQWCAKDKRWTGRFHLGVPEDLKRFVSTS